MENNVSFPFAAIICRSTNSFIISKSGRGNNYKDYKVNPQLTSLIYDIKSEMWLFSQYDAITVVIWLGEHIFSLYDGSYLNE